MPKGSNLKSSAEEQPPVFCHFSQFSKSTLAC